MECLRCGNCCPDNCEFKRKDSDDLFTCTIHQSITGKPRHTMLCDFPPLRYYLSGIACRALLECLVENWEDFMKSDKVRKLPNGQIKLRELSIDIPLGHR